MCLTHHVKQKFDTPHFKAFVIEWQGIIKSLQFKEDEFIPENVIWQAFRVGVEAERDRIYAITGEWPPKNKKEN